ncbi:hypothetical protein BVC80_1767g24 [Macleaya cordata]|uniref:DUF7731 domain-containing protein n=1 Tax=Macleaya cordata TaxID=56857 RepID=A0A200QTB9_MACCD|nr:hypothetical protein BVC80_1767g24 [Macleaya cordata]
MGKGGKNEYVWCLLVGILLMSCCTKAEDGGIKQVIEDPRKNPNLSPFEQWLSAYKCLQNVSDSCADKFVLTELGNLGVTSNDTNDYCKACAEHTRAVLTCISMVKRDYQFRNGATVHDLNNTITNGCSSGFTGDIIKSNSIRVYVSNNIFTTTVSALMAWFLITNF